ncbi:hypothetical protein ACFX2F_032043 [Malus domestica]
MPTTMQLLCPKLSYFNVHGCQELHYSQNVCLAGNYFTGCEFDKVQLSGGFQLQGFKLRHRGVLSARSSFFKNMFSAKRDFVSSQGYMPRDLYNMNSRYGNMDELKETVKTFHDTSLKLSAGGFMTVAEINAEIENAKSRTSRSYWSKEKEKKYENNGKEV